MTADGVGLNAGSGRHRKRQGELLQEVWIGLSEVERHGAGHIIGHDPLVEVALSRVAFAFARADDPAVERSNRLRGRRVHTFDCSAEVRRPDR